MSKRTRENKGKSKLKDQSWKDTLPKFYRTKIVVSKGNTNYENLVPYYKVSPKAKKVNLDMVSYLQRFFSKLF